MHTESPELPTTQADTIDTVTLEDLLDSTDLDRLVDELAEDIAEEWEP